MHPKLQDQIEKIRADAHLEALSVALHDTANDEEFEHEADRWFHAASTFKAALLLVFAKAVESGRVRAKDHLQIRNRFLSVKTSEPYRIGRDRDGDSSTHAQIGRSLPLHALVRVMITRSSNLATNLLLDFLTLDYIHETLQVCGVEGIEVRRGVEDLAAHEAGINNEATAAGLCRLFRCFLPGGCLSDEAREMALEILRAQEFNRMLPARLPKEARVAHKTGEISTHCHDAGLVFPPDRAPYAVAIMTQHAPENDHPQRAVAEVSAALYRHFVS